MKRHFPRRLGALISAASAAALTPAPALAEPADYVIDPGHTHVTFSVERFGFADTIGVFPDSQGTVRLDPEAPETSSVTARVATPTVWSGLAAREAAIRSPHWLDTDAFDAITFRSTEVELTGETTARVTGDFTLLGVTRPETFDVTLNRIGPDPSMQGREAAGFSITGAIDRSDYGLETALAIVGDTVEIRIEALAHRAE